MADERTKTDNPDPDVETGADSAPADGAAEDRASDQETASAQPMEGGEEIDLSEGKTLSDYLEDEPEATKAKSGPGEFR